jgi:hypothetical protein
MKPQAMTAKQYQELINKPKETGLKFGNVWTEVDGIKFQSKAEANYYGRLKVLKRAGMIKDFKRQVPFRIVVNGIFICTYKADFVVYHNSGTRDVVDVKSEATENLYFFQLKKKLLFALHGITLKIAK